jgi:hypothetical protein
MSAGPSERKTGIPHSGDLPVDEGGERPVVTSAAPLSESALAPSSLAGQELSDEELTLVRQKQDEAAEKQAARREQYVRRRSIRRKATVGMGALTVATAAVLGGAFALKAKSDSGNNTEPQDNPGVSAPVVPGNPEVPSASPTETEESPQQERDAMHYVTSDASFVDQAFYDNAPTSSGDGPVGGPDASQYIDKDTVSHVVDGILNNITVATETGNEDAVIAAYHQTAPGEFGNSQDEVDVIEQQSELKQQFIEQNPDYPVSGLVREEVVSVAPDPTDKNKVSVTFTVLHTTYGNYVEGQDVVKFQSQETWSFDLVRESVAGLSDGSTPTSWLVENSSVDSSVPVQN